MLPLRVLVVDDYRDSADAFAMLLKLGGHQVEVCYSGEEAERLAPQFRPDVAFLDVAMPEKDGCQVAVSIKEHPALSDCVLIAITGFGQCADRLRCRSAGFDHFLVKPADPREIEAILKDIQARALVA